MDSNLKKTIILENYQNPQNRGLIDDDSYIKASTNSKSCIDEINLMVKVVDDKIVDARFDGEACAICTSSTSIMIQKIIGKSVLEAKNLIDNFEKMLKEEEYDEDILEEAIVYSDISKEPNRIKCAELPWTTLEKALSQIKKVS